MTENTKIKIRQAGPFDVSNLMRLLDQSIKDNAYPDPDYHMALNWITSIINEGYVLVAEKSGRLIGTVAVTNFKFPWSQRWFLYVDWLYVSRAFREGGVFDAMMKALHAYADEKSAPIFGGVSSGTDARLKDRLMGMSGYQYVGGQFIRDLEAENGQREEDDQDETDLHAAELD